MEKSNLFNQLSKMLTLFASAIIGVQIVVILVQGQGVCLNEGCAIVERLTRVSPLVFNLAGLAFFQTLFWSLHFAGKGSAAWLWFARLLLLAGIAAEGALVGFQHLVAKTFCSYCLIILGFIVLLNCLAGWRHVVRGLFVFSAVLIAMFSLVFDQVPGTSQSLKGGTFASRLIQAPSEELTLFFSSTCQHCENVIESLRDNSTFSISFNPVDAVSSLDFPGIMLNEEYSAVTNRRFLASLEIEEVPVLVAKTVGTIQVLQGEQAILDYLYPAETTEENPDEIDYSGSSSIQEQLLPGVATEKDGCGVTLDCDDSGTIEASSGQDK